MGFVIVAVQLEIVEGGAAILDKGIEVISFLEVQVKLPIVRIGRDELTAYRLVYFSKDGFHLGKQIIRRISTEFFYARLIKAQPISQFFCGCPQSSIDVSGGKPMDRKRVITRKAIGLYAGRVNACWMRDSNT